MICLNYTHYLRWETIFRNDVQNLQSFVSDHMLEAFYRLTVFFSSIVIDRLLELNSKVVKVDSGAIDIMEGKETLFEWAPFCSYINDIIRK